MEFPALKDTNFPDLKNSQPYKYQNKVDYSQWQPETKIKLLQVPWDNEYLYTVDFGTDEARDKWINEQAGESIELTTDFARLPETSVRVPLPAPVAQRYNYCVVDIPQYPSTGEPFNYETQHRVHRFCYFIDDVIYRSPNASELILSMDSWTTFLHSIEVKSLFLERGHAPMYDTTADAYLANPRENSEGILTPDINFGNLDIIAGHKYKALHANDTKFILFASTIPYAEIDNIGTVTSSGRNTPAAFANRETRSGYQEIVNNYRWASNGYDYSHAVMPSALSGTTDGTTANGLYMYAITFVNFDANKTRIADRAPHFINSIKAAYIVPDSLFEKGKAHTIAGFTFVECKSKDTISAGVFRLTKELFDYPRKYRDIAKLYTFPYALLEFSDDSGSMFELKIEQMGDKLNVIEQVSIAYPFLNWNVLLANANSSAEAISYSFRNLNNVSSDIENWASDYNKFSLQWDIPTYAIYADAATQYAMKNYKAAQQQREAAIVAYQSSVRGSNTGRENALDSNQLSKTNTDASNDTMVANTRNANNTSAANLNIANAAGTANVRAGVSCSYNINTRNNAAIADLLYADQILQDAMLETDLEKMGMSTIASGIGGAISGIAEGALAGAGIGAAAGSVVPGAGTAAGAAAGAVAGVVGGVVSAITGGMQNAIIANASAAQLSANKVNQAEHATSTILLNDNGTILQGNLQTEVNAQNVQASVAQNNNTISMTNTNAANTSNTNKANATRTQSVGNANATYTRDTTIENAKEALRIAQDRYSTEYESARLLDPVVQGAYAGDATQDVFKRRGVHMRVKTQSKNAIARAGDYFLRYGYAYEGFYEVQSWTCNKERCYWRAHEVAIAPKAGTDANAISVIAAILKNGTTVYAKPELVGSF